MSGSLDRLRGWWRRDAFRDVGSFVLHIGYPRSGHSLIGALLNAHPEVVIAHELDVLKLVGQGYSRNQIFSALLDRDQWWRRRDWKWSGWSYRVEGGAQGRFTTLRVIGDKAGGLTSRHLAGGALPLERLAEIVGTPVKLIHHVRNPFDTLATMSIKGQPGVSTLEEAIDRYFGEHCMGIGHAKGWGGHSVLDVYHEELVQDPSAGISGICHHLGVEAPADYVQACSRLVHPSTRKSRTRIEWTTEQIDRVHTSLSDFPWLTRYGFEGK